MQQRQGLRWKISICPFLPTGCMLNLEKALSGTAGANGSLICSLPLHLFRKLGTCSNDLPAARLLDISISHLPLCLMTQLLYSSRNTGASCTAYSPASSRTGPPSEIFI
jgi:hypothetical protein